MEVALREESFHELQAALQEQLDAARNKIEELQREVCATVMIRQDWMIGVY